MGDEESSRDAVADDGGVDWAAVFGAEQRRLRRIAVRLVGEARADDLVQETFLRAYRFRSSFAAGSSVQAWLTTIARRAAIDLLRRDRLADDVHTRLGPQPAHAPSVDDVVTNRIRRDGITAALSSLTDRQRRVLIDAELGMGGTAEVGSPAAVKSVVARARRNFRERYQAIARENGVFGGSVLSPSAANRLRAAVGKVQSEIDRFDPAAAFMTGLLLLGAARSAGPVESFSVSQIQHRFGSSVPAIVRARVGDDTAGAEHFRGMAPTVTASARVGTGTETGHVDAAGSLSTPHSQFSWETHSDGHSWRNDMSGQAGVDHGDDDIWVHSFMYTNCQTPTGRPQCDVTDVIAKTAPSGTPIVTDGGGQTAAG